jgi:hypothetical protein
VHADLRSGLNAVAPLNRFQMDHARSAMRVAFTASLNTRFTSDASRVIDEETHFTHRIPPASTPKWAISSVGSVVLLTRTAQILYSGMFDTGSIAGLVTLLIDRPSGQ